MSATKDDRYEGLSAGTFCLSGHIDVPTERLDEVREALTQHITLTRAEEGCIFFNVDACPKVAGRFLVSEAFVDEEAFKVHQSRGANSSWAEVSVGIPREYETWVVG